MATNAEEDRVTVAWLHKQHLLEKRERRDVVDERTPGLVVRVAPSGISWWFRTKAGGVPRRTSLGVYPELKLSDARRLAQSAADVLRRGVAEPDAIWVIGKRIEFGIDILPIAEPRLPRTKSRWTYAQAREAYLVEVERTLRPATHRSYRQFLSHPSLQPLEHEPVAGITRQELATILSTVHRNNGETQSANLASALRPMWTYLSLDHVVSNSGVEPEVMEKLRAPKRSRIAAKATVERDPNMKSVGRLLAIARSGMLHPTISAAVELTIMTAQRRLTVVQAKRQHFRDEGEFYVWTMPSTDLKTGDRRKGRNGELIQEHEIPLPAGARAAVERTISGSEPSTWLFPQVKPQKVGDTVTHLNESTLSKTLRELPDIDFTPHDLRTALTNTLRAAGYGRDASSLILDHAEGRTGVTTRHYDTYRELQEKAEKLGIWSAAVEAAAADEAPRLDLRMIKEHLRIVRAKRASKARIAGGRGRAKSGAAG